MAGLRNLRSKWYARIFFWDGYRRTEKLIPLRTEFKTTARLRLAEVNRYEKDIKNGIDYSFSWLNQEGVITVKLITLQECIDKYLIYMKNNGCKTATVDRAFYCLKNLTQCLGGKFPIETIGTSHIEMFKSSFKGKLTDNGININLTRIRAFLNWSKDIQEILDRTPNIKMIRVLGKMPSYLTEVEQSDIMELDWLDSHYKNTFKMYLETGCRLREPFNGIIDGSWLIVNEDDSKTGIPREIHLNTFHIETIIEMKNRALQSNANLRTFTTKYSRIFKKVVTVIGRGDLHFHNLRDTFALMKYLSTRDIYQVSKELGHTSVKVTQNYTKFRLSKLEQDFPSLTVGYLNRNSTKTVVTDTHFTDTNKNYFKVIEEKYWN